MFHIHRWRTVETLDWVTYYRKYVREPGPSVPTPPPITYGFRAVVGMALQECRCGARRSKHILQSEFPPMDRWERKGGTP